MDGQTIGTLASAVIAGIALYKSHQANQIAARSHQAAQEANEIAREANEIARQSGEKQDAMLRRQVEAGLTIESGGSSRTGGKGPFWDFAINFEVCNHGTSPIRVTGLRIDYTDGHKTFVSKDRDDKFTLGINPPDNRRRIGDGFQVPDSTPLDQCYFMATVFFIDPLTGSQASFSGRAL